MTLTKIKNILFNIVFFITFVALVNWGGASRWYNEAWTKWPTFSSSFENRTYIAWWRNQMETFSALLAICAGNSPVPGEFSAQRPVTWSFDVFFDLRLNKRLSKHSWGRWFETLPRPLWCHSNGVLVPNFLTCFSDRSSWFGTNLKVDASPASSCATT